MEPNLSKSTVKKADNTPALSPEKSINISRKNSVSAFENKGRKSTVHSSGAQTARNHEPSLKKARSTFEKPKQETSASAKKRS